MLTHDVDLCAHIINIRRTVGLNKPVSFMQPTYCDKPTIKWFVSKKSGIPQYVFGLCGDCPFEFNPKPGWELEEISRETAMVWETTEN